MLRLSFALAALISSTEASDYVYSETKSTNATVKLRALSSAVFKHHQGGVGAEGENAVNSTPTMGCANDVQAAIEDMQGLIEDIPGAGFILSHIFPGNSDSKKI